MTEEVKCATFNAKIFIAGPIEVAKQVLREEMLKDGFGCQMFVSLDYIMKRMNKEKCNGK